MWHGVSTFIYPFMQNPNESVLRGPVRKILCRAASSSFDRVTVPPEKPSTCKTGYISVICFVLMFVKLSLLPMGCPFPEGTPFGHPYEYGTTLIGTTSQRDVDL